MTVATATARTSRCTRRSATAARRRGIEFVRRTSLGAVLATSLFAAGEAAAQVNLPPNQTGTATDTAGSSSFGNQTINFTAAGGTLTLNGQGVLVNNRLEARWYDSEFGTGFLNPIANLISATAEGVNELNGPLDLVDDAAFTAASLNLADLETFSGLWRGFMNITTPGVHQFRTGSDDGSVFWIDLNRDGTFGAGELIVDHNRDQGYVVSPVASINLAAGNYPVAIGFYENGGGNRMDAMFRRPSDSALQFVNPSAAGQAGIWSYIQNQTQSADFSTNAINFDASGTVTVDGIRSAEARVGAVTIDRGLTVTTNGSRVVAPSTTITSTGTGDVTFAGTGQLFAGTANTSGNVINFISAGSGSGGVYLDKVASSIAAGSTLTVSGGKAGLAVGGGNTPIGNSPITLSGGTLAILSDLSVANGPGIFNVTGQWYPDDNVFDALIAVPPDSANTIGWIGLDSKAQLDGKLNPRTPIATRSIATEINFPRAGGNLVDGGTNDDANDIFNTGGASLGVGLTGNDDFALRFTGKLNVTTAGATEFLLMSNDGATMFLDMDTGPGINWQKVVDNNRHSTTGGAAFQGHYSGSPNGVTDPNLTVDAGAPAIPNPAAPNLAVGVYDFIVGSFNKNANEYGIELFWTPSGGSRRIIPFAAGGSVTLNNTITISGNSGLDVQTPAATLGGLRMNPGSSMLVSGGPLTSAVTATGAGTVTIGSTGGAVSLTELIDGGNAVNFIAGAGRVLLTRSGGPGPGFGATSKVGASTGGTLVVSNTIAGNPLNGAPVLLTGGTLELNVAPVGSGAFTAGLREGRVPGAFNITDPNPNDRGILLEPIRAQVVGNGNVEPFPDNTTYIYSGQMLFPANSGGMSQFAFAECFDDSTQIKIDGVERLNNTVWNVANTTGVLSVTAGWHDVEFRFGEGGGGWGPSGQNGWVQNPAPGIAPGFGVDFTLPIDSSDPPLQSEFARPVDNGTMNLFRVAGFATPNFASNVTATENSTINVTGVTGAQIGGVSMAAGKTLSLTGNPLQIAGSIEGAGTVRATAIVDFTKSGAASSGSPIVDIVRGGTVNFSPGNGNTFGGSAVSAINNEGTLRAVNGITDLSGAVVTTTNVPGTVISSGLSNISGDFYDTTAVPLPLAPDSTNTFGWSGLDSKAQFDAALAGKTPLATRNITGLEINFPRGNASLVDGGTNDFGPEEIFNVDGANLGVPLSGNTDFVVRFTGKLNMTTAGATGFGMAANDGAVLFLDLDQGAGTNWVKVADHNRFSTTGGGAFDEHGTAGVNNAPTITQTPAPNLSVGTYDFAVGFYNSNANEAGIELYWVPPGGARSIIPLGAVSGPTLVQVDSGATLKLGALIGVNQVNVAANARLELHGPTSNMLASGLSIAGTPAAPTGTLDVTDSALVLDYPTAGPNPAADVRARIIAGRGAPGLLGTWDGKGITSSTSAAAPDTTSVGYAVNADMPLGAVTTFRGVSVDPTTVLIRHTRIGDANLDGLVNDDDVTIVGATYAPGVANASWANGDFDYNGFVDDDDVTLLGALYNPLATPIPSPAAGGGVAAVPEPSTWLMLTLGGLSAGLFGWRRRRHA